MITTYASLCAEYYDLDKPNAPEKALYFFMSFVHETHGKILEPMCGTGRFLLPILQAGFLIEGHDDSPHMLDILKRKAKIMQLEPNVQELSIEQIRVENVYALIMIPSCSFGLITDEEKSFSIFGKLYDSLQPAGKLIFDIETLFAVPTRYNVWEGKIRQSSDKSFIILSTLNLPPKGNIGTVICKYEKVQANQVVQTEVEELKIKLYEPKELAQRLKAVGFSEVILHKAHQRSVTPAESDVEVVFECIK